MNGYLYRGRHRRPTHTARRAVTVAAGGAVAFGGPGLVELATVPTAAAASPEETLADIRQCESTGNPRAVNQQTRAHFGLYQFDLSTWRSVGRSPYRRPDGRRAIRAQPAISPPRN